MGASRAACTRRGSRPFYDTAPKSRHRPTKTTPVRADAGRRPSHPSPSRARRRPVTTVTGRGNPRENGGGVDARPARPAGPPPRRPPVARESPPSRQSAAKPRTSSYTRTNHHNDTARSPHRSCPYPNNTNATNRNNIPTILRRERQTNRLRRELRSFVSFVTRRRPVRVKSL